MKKLTVLLLIISSSLFEKFFAQNVKIDALYQIINSAKHDTNEVNALLKIGILKYLPNGNYDSANLFYNRSLKLAEHLGYKRGIGNCLNNIGIIYFYKYDFPMALKYYLKALRIAEELGDKKNCGYYSGNIGTIYHYQKAYSKALEYYLKTLKITLESSDTKSIGLCYLNLGILYTDLKNYTMASGQFFSAIKMFETNNNKEELASSYIGIGNLYNEQQDLINAIIYFQKGANLANEIENIQDLESCYINISKSYNKLNKYNLALAYADSALIINQKTDDINKKRLIYQNTAEIQSKLGNYKAAYDAQLKYQQLNDSIFNEENSKQLSDLKTNFEIEKKETELKTKQEKKDLIAKEEKEKQKVILFSVLAGLFLVIVFAVFMFNRFRVTQKQKNIIELKEKETQQQNEVIKIQKHLVEEKHKEITDSINYAERIQRSFLAAEKQLNENLNNYFVLFKPKDVVSGDFYWSAKLSNGNFALVTADSTGHGVPGAIMSLLNVTSLEKAIEHYTNPSDILNHTRQTIIERLKKDGSEEGGKDGMDCSLLVFDFSTNQLLIAAANNPVWIVRQNNNGVAELVEVKPDKMPVGKSDKQDQSFTTHTIELQKGDTIYTLTDGFPDQFGGDKGKKFMSKKLKELLLTNVHLPIAQQKELLESTFKNWVGDLEQVDDVTVIGIRI